MIKQTSSQLLPSLTDARADAVLAESILVKAKLHCTKSSINICPTKLLQNVVKHHVHLSPHFAITIRKSIDSKTDVLNTKSRQKRATRTKISEALAKVRHDIWAFHRKGQLKIENHKKAP